MNSKALILKKQIQLGFWPGITVGMYPSQFAYKPIEVDLPSLWKNTEEVNLYYHIPFCKWKCTYCTFFAIPKAENDVMQAYIKKLNEQVRLYNGFLSKRMKVKSICFGGGTPNVLALSQVEDIFNTLQRENVSFDNNLEPSMEVSPELLTYDYLSGLRQIGIKRVSLGLQSLKSEIREAINRDKNLDIHKIFEMLRANDLNVNIDVINGIPGQKADDFMATLSEVVSYKPETISIYPLSGRDNSLFKKSSGLMTTKEKYVLFDTFYDFLISNGYRCESHVKFVRSDTTSTHQQKIYEYTGTETLGLGCGARSYNEQAHYSITSSEFSYLERAKAINAFIEKPFDDFLWAGMHMSEEENKRRFIIYAFFLGSFSPDSYFNKFQTHATEEFSDEFDALKQNDLISKEGDQFYLTKKGRKYTDLVGTMFWSKNINALFANALKHKAKFI